MHKTGVDTGTSYNEYVIWNSFICLFQNELYMVQILLVSLNK